MANIELCVLNNSNPFRLINKSFIWPHIRQCIASWWDYCWKWSNKELADLLTTFLSRIICFVFVGAFDWSLTGGPKIDTHAHTRTQYPVFTTIPNYVLAAACYKGTVENISGFWQFLGQTGRHKQGDNGLMEDEWEKKKLQKIGRQIYIPQHTRLHLLLFIFMDKYLKGIYERQCARDGMCVFYL